MAFLISCILLSIPSSDTFNIQSILVSYTCARVHTHTHSKQLFSLYVNKKKNTNNEKYWSDSYSLHFKNLSQFNGKCHIPLLAAETVTDSDQGTAACCLQCLKRAETSAKQKNITLLHMWQLRFSQWWWWSFTFFGMWRCVNLYIVFGSVRCWRWRQQAV